MSGEQRHAYFLSNDDIGLYLVRASTENVQYTSDIFIVHGLNGGAARTWRHENNAIWFRDFLPEIVKNDVDRTNARIWTYGYPAVADFSRPVCDMTPFQFAQDLLLRVKAKRDGREEAHKIIWVCHSLGGIVVKNALVQAYNRPEYASIWSSTVGIVFLGTPHQGSSAASFGDVAMQIARACGAAIDSNLLRHLKPNCNSLRMTAAEFLRIASHIKIFSFYENRPQIRGRLVVTSESALLMIPRETTAPLHSNHCDMGKYSSFDDPNYAQISYSIRELMRLTSFSRRSVNIPRDSTDCEQALVNTPSPGTRPLGTDSWTDSIITSESDSRPSTPSSLLPQRLLTNRYRRSEPFPNPTSEKGFAAIVREGNLAGINSAIDSATETDQDQLLYWKAKALRYSLEIDNSNLRFKVFYAFLNAETAQLDEPDSYGNYLPQRVVLHKGCDSSYLHALFSVGVNPGLKDAKPERGFRPLHLAVIKNRLDIVNYLVTNKTLINAGDSNKRTPLWHAVELVDASDSRMRTVEILLANGGDKGPYPKNEIFEKKITKLYKKHGLKKSKTERGLYCRR